MNKIRLATVFSGIGAVEFALKRMGLSYEIVFACDNGERDIQYNIEDEMKIIKKMNDPEEKCDYVRNLYDSKTRKTNFVEYSYLANYECTRNKFFQDINLLDGNDFKDQVDLFVGGSPCQSFSSVGFKAGLEDTRGTLFYQFARLIKEIQPKVFIYENVRNLLNHDKGRTWKVIQDVFDSLGYKYTYAILNSSNYGIPQTRRRLFVVGFKVEVVFEMPKEKELRFSMKDFLVNNCSYGNFTHDESGNIQIKKEPGTILSKYYLSPKIYSYVMKGGTKSFYQKPVINLEVARTILKTMGNHHRAGIDNYVSADGSTSFGSVRMLSEREAMRLMGFTDDYKIVVSQHQAYKQAGNSIVVDVLIEIIKEILKTKIIG